MACQTFAHVRGRLDALTGPGGHEVLGHDQILGADDDDVVAGVTVTRVPTPRAGTE